MNFIEASAALTAAAFFAITAIALTALLAIAFAASRAIRAHVMLHAFSGRRTTKRKKRK
jgi:hypothetical protein